MSRTRKRRRWKAEEKLRIVLAGMETGVEVSDLCRREGINPTMFYGGKKKLLSGAVKIFDESASRPPAEAVRAEAGRTRMKSVVAESEGDQGGSPNAENLELKKSLSG